jgi:hypothetical protein
VLGAIVWVARRKVRVESQPLVWLAILILATLRSPFLPMGYGAVPAVWLLTLLAATWGPAPRVLLGALGMFVALSIYLPTDVPLDPRWLALVTLVPQAALLATAVLAMRLPSRVEAA